MKLQIDVPKLIAELEKSIKDYDVEYKKLLAKYVVKQEEYIKYLKKVAITEGIVEKLKYHPSMPSNIRGNYLDNLEALKAHIKDTVEMSSNEYNDIKDGQRRLRDDIVSNTTALGSLSY